MQLRWNPDETEENLEVLLKKAINALQASIEKVKSTHPLDDFVMSVIPLWNKVFKALSLEGRDLNFTVDYELTPLPPAPTGLITTEVGGYFSEISNEDNPSHAIYKCKLTYIKYKSKSDELETQKWRSKELVLQTWYQIYEFLAKLLERKAKWEIY